MYYILDDIRLLEKYDFVGNSKTVRFSLDKKKFIVESLKPIKELSKFEYSKEDALKIMSTNEWYKDEI